jgi:hypothetical protein
MTSEQVERADEIVDEMISLLDEFDSIVRQCDRKIIYERFKAYPKGHIEMALSNDHSFVGTSMFPLRELVEEMQGEVESDEEEDDGCTCGREPCTCN